MSDVFEIRTQDMRVAVRRYGAELHNIITADGRCWLWGGNPDFWSGRAPILFPVIGKSLDGRVPIAGDSYPMPPHGFARASTFQLTRQTITELEFQLVGSPETYSHFPFDFELAVSFRLDGVALACKTAITNRSARVMPFCLGFHPAFRWPIEGYDERRHIVRLFGLNDRRVSRLDKVGCIGTPSTDPRFSADAVELTTDLFAQGAAIYRAAGASQAWFGASDGDGIGMSFAGLPYFGLWSAPGAPFVCLEPWHGLPPRIGADAALEARPGAILLDAGETTSLEIRMVFGVTEAAFLSQASLPGQ